MYHLLNKGYPNVNIRMASYVKQGSNISRTKIN